MSDKIAVYYRVSTEEQSMDRQRNATAEYAEMRFDAKPAELEYYEDKSTRTNLKRDDYRELLQNIDSIDIVVVKELSRLARSLQDLESTVDDIVGNNSEVHFIEEGIEFRGEDDPFQQLQLQILWAVAEFEAKLRQQSAPEGLQARFESDGDYTHGPASLGYGKDDAILFEKESYGTVCEVLQRVKNGELSKRKAAKKPDSSRATILRCIRDRPELYNLNIPGEQGES